MPATLRLPAPPARRPSANPASDPRFKVVKDKLSKGSSNLKKHPPAAKKALEAQKAALPPAKEKLVGAQANQVDTMQEAKAKKPDPNSFLALLRAEIEKVMPKNLDQADNFMEGGEQQQMKGAVTGKVDAQKQEASGEIKSATDQAPDQSKVVGKVVTPIPGEPTPVMPGINAGEGMPQARPEADVSQQQNKKDADQQMADAEVTPQQMQKANDPRFSSVLAAKTQVEKVADATPAKYRTGEKAALAKAVVGAQSQSKLGISALLGVKTKSGTAVKSRQQIAKEKDEARRKEVGDNIEKIYNQTKLNVEAKLASLETDVSRLFDVGANAAIDNMKNNSRREIEKFKDDRYSGIRGWGRWIADRFRDVPPEIKQILQRNRAKFTQEMDTLVVRIANVVETRLQQAKNEITQGQGRIKSYVAGLPKDLQAVGKAAEREMAGRFEELQQGIEDRKNALAQKLAQQYKEASDKADKALQEIEDENRSALYGFIAKLAEIVKILLEFKNKLMSILRKGWETIKLILADPIGFLSNLISAIKGGFEAFVNNIWEHLKKGFMKWLFGALAGAGIEIPSDLSLPSILKLVLSVLGITYEKMRAKAVKLLGPTAVAVIEKVVEYIRTLVTGGPAALWEKIKEDLSNLKEMVIDAIQDWLITTIVKQAVTKIVSMFNPAGAIVQAVLMIYNVVMFVVERAAQIMEFVEAVINSVHQIATGAIGTAVSWIERALANMIPIMIGFLASLIGLGGISAKIKEFILKVQTKVDLAIDKMIGKAVGWVRKAFGKNGKNKLDKRTDSQKLADLEKARNEANAALSEEGRRKMAEKNLKVIKQKYNLTRADIVIDETKKGTTIFHAELEINPIAKSNKAGEMDFIDPPLKVAPSFVCKKSLDKAEFKRQIELQQATINQMNVHEWLANRARFLDKGRSKEGTKEQRRVMASAVAAFRAKIVMERTSVYKGAPYNMSDDQALSKASGFANRLLAYETKKSGLRTYKISKLTDTAYDGKGIHNEIYGKAALHKLDQVAGGAGTDVDPMLGGAREDFSIGAAWNGARIEGLHKNVKKEIKGKKAAEQKNIRMVVELPVNYE